jgi:dTDP-4-amino-4,6-dideoxygalactose transaminase
MEIRTIADKYGLLLLEDGAQGFGGDIEGKKACSFGDISTTSFFPAKPLGCYGDGGAIFTDNDKWAATIRSLCVHGKGKTKYDNVRIGMNSRLDTIQAAVLLAKLDQFTNYELEHIQSVVEWFNNEISDKAEKPFVAQGYRSSWAQYTIKLRDKKTRNRLIEALDAEMIPYAIYYEKAMHKQVAFNNSIYSDLDYTTTNKLCERVLSLPCHPYLKQSELEHIVNVINKHLG